MSEKFDPNIVERLRKKHEELLDAHLDNDEIDYLFSAIDYWRKALDKEHKITVRLLQKIAKGEEK